MNAVLLNKIGSEEGLDYQRDVSTSNIFADNFLRISNKLKQSSKFFVFFYCILSCFNLVCEANPPQRRCAGQSLCLRNF